MSVCVCVRCVFKNGAYQCLFGLLILACVVSGNNLIYDPMPQKRMTRCSFLPIWAIAFGIRLTKYEHLYLFLCLFALAISTIFIYWLYHKSFFALLCFDSELFILKESSQRWPRIRYFITLATQYNCFENERTEQKNSNNNNRMEWQPNRESRYTYSLMKKKKNKWEEQSLN